MLANAAKKSGKGGLSLVIGIGGKPKKGEPEADDTEDMDDDSMAEATGQALLDAFESKDPKEVYAAFKTAVDACKGY